MKKLLLMLCFFVASSSTLYAASIKKIKTATVEGQAFLKTRGGDIKRCSGEDVILFSVEDIGAFNSQNRYKNYLKKSLLSGSSPLYSEKAIYDEILNLYPELKSNIPSYRIYERVDFNNILQAAIEKEAKNPSPSFTKPIFKTMCDANGDFQFKNIPYGSYIVATTVQWLAGSEPQGGTVTSDIIGVNERLQKIFLTK